MMLSTETILIYPKLNETKLSVNFALSEFKCPCNYISCRATIIYRPLIDLLEKIRNEIASPLLVTSGYRCPEHNRDVKGAALSGHLVGGAADIHPAIPVEMSRLASIAQSFGACGIGTYEKHLHVDCFYGPAKVARLWESAKA